MKYKTLTLLSLALVFSCDSLFHEDSDDYIVLDSEQEILDILNGIYAQLVQVYDEGYFEALCRADDINLYPNYYFLWPEWPSGCGSYYSHDYAPNYENIYHPLVKIILNANSEILQLSGEKDAIFLGEFYFLRAYAYYTLARFFGNPHLVKDIDVSYTVQRPTCEEVYEFIEQDLIRALELLPLTKQYARIPGETPHQGTAKSILAEVYLSWAGNPINDGARYRKAVQHSGEVISARSMYGYDLLDDYGSLWKSTNKHHAETIFGIYYDYSNVATRNRIGDMFVGWLNDRFRVSSHYHPEFYFYERMPNNSRKINSFNNIEKRYLPSVDPCFFINRSCSTKWVDTTEYFLNDSISNIPGRYGTSTTLYLLRYAQTLLTFSESRARCGILDDSTYEAVNMIRRRANGVDPYTPSEFDLEKNLSQEQFIDSVVWERAWELNFEPNGRWFDIVRLDLKDKLPEYRYDFDFPYEVPEEYLQDNWYFYKIPE
jgi:hypothetical protein